jgi:PAS domain S-box-containing protein
VSFEWASWIVTRRSAIDRSLAAKLGDALPGPAAPESEALRRFRSYAASALRRGSAAAPALDGVRVEVERACGLLEGWCGAAVEVAGARGPELRALLEPLAAEFRTALRGSHVAQRARRARPGARRAVSAAIDRIGDAFLAVDPESGEVVDANPAAAALLGVRRPDLIGARAARFVHGDTRESWREQLETLVESAEPRRFRSIWIDALTRPIAVEVNATRLATRARTLALVVARPV